MQIPSSCVLASLWLSTLFLAAAARRPGRAAVPGRVAVYFGQNSFPGSDSLAIPCSSPSVDIVIITFINRYFAAAGLPAMSIGPLYCNTRIPGTDLLSCPQLAGQIKECQRNGKRVFMSLGGESGGPGQAPNTLDSQDKVQKLADNLWALFGEGKGMENRRPFGDALVDGFDLDNEDHNPSGYPELVTALRTHFASSPTNRRYYLSAAPQCYRPEASLGTAVYTVDHVFIQMYNNPSCGANAGSASTASLRTWSDDIAARTTANTTLFAGYLAAQQAGGSGYVPAAEMARLVKEVKGLPNFGGVMLWDAAFGHANVGPDGMNYIDSAKAAVM